MSATVEAATMRAVFARLIPLLFALMFFNHLDRINIGVASLQMNQQLGLTPAVFGFAGSLFFLGYMLLEVRSNLLLHRIGARRWIARILITWGLVAGFLVVSDAIALFHARRSLHAPGRPARRPRAEP